MRIAFLGHKNIPSRQGGIEVVVEELATRMAQKGNDVTVYNRKHSKNVSGSNSQQHKLYKGIKMKYVLTLDKKGLAALTSSFFATIAVTFFGNYDIIHYHAEGPCAMMWLPKLLGKRCIATIHGLDHQRAKWGKIASKYILFGERCAVKYADEIIVLSKDMQDYFKKKYNRQTTFIPNGVNKPILLESSIIKKKYNLDKDDYILYLGRIVPEKGLKYLVDVYKTLDTNKKLVIAGGSSDTSYFEAEIKEMAKEDDRIIFTGFVQGKELDELYSNAYIYALPSDLEGMPLSLLEAMSYGNCCLTSDIPECASVVEDKAVVFKKSNERDLKLKLKMLLDNPQLVKSYKSQASRYILKKYDWNSVVNKTLDVYRGVNFD